MDRARAVKLALHSGGTKAARQIHTRTGGVTKAWARARMRTGGALKQFYAAVAVTLSSYKVIGRGNSASVVPVISAPVTATISGALGSVSHVWTRTTPDAQPWTINNPDSETTTFTTDCDQNERFAATFIDTVTDSVTGQVLISDPVAVDCANIYYGGGYIGGQPPAPGTYYP